MKRTLPVLILLTALTALTACGEAADVDGGGGGAGVGGDTALADRVFVATSVTENGGSRAIVDGTTVTLTFDADGRLLASAGCNSMQGTYRVTDGTLGVSDLSTTDMGCDPVRHQQDAWVADFLSAAPRMTLDGHDLTLTAGERAIVLLDREIAQPNAALEGPTWIVDTLLTAEVASSMPAGANATMVFDSATVSIDTGCNTGTGSYTRSGDRITFGPISLTRKACAEPGLMEVEQTMVAALAGEATYDIEADRLTIRHSTGHGIQLRAQP
jgi:heat shock protein HslJ